MIIDPPSPFAPLKEWEDFLQEMRAIKKPDDDVRRAIKEADREIKRRKGV